MENNIVNDLLQTYNQLRKRNYKFIVEDKRDGLQAQASQARNKPVTTVKQNQGTAKDQSSPGDVVQFDNSDNVSNAGDTKKYFIGPDGEQIPMDGGEENGTDGLEVKAPEIEDIFVKFTATTKKWDGELGDETTDHALLYRLSAVQGRAEAPLDPSAAITFAANYFSKHFPIEWDTLKNNKHLDFFGTVLADLAQAPFFVGTPLSVEYTDEEINSIAHTLSKYREYIFTNGTLDDKFSKYASEFLFQPLEGGRSRIYFKGEDSKKSIEIKSDFIPRMPKHRDILPAFLAMSGGDGAFFTPKKEDFNLDLCALLTSFINNSFLFAKKEISNDTFVNNITNSKSYIEELAAIYASVKSMNHNEKGYQILGGYESQVREWCDRLFDGLVSLQDNPYLITNEMYNLSNVFDNIWKIMHNISLACAQGVNYIESTIGFGEVDLDHYFSINGRPYCRLNSIPIINSKMKAVDNLLLIKDDETAYELGNKLLEKFSPLSPEKDYYISKILNRTEIIGYIKRCILLSTGSKYREPYVVDVIKEYISAGLGTVEGKRGLIIHSDIHPRYLNPVMVLDKRSLAQSLIGAEYTVKATDVGADVYLNDRKSIIFEVTSDGFLDMHPLPHLLQQFSISTGLNPYLLPGFI